MMIVIIMMTRFTTHILFPCLRVCPSLLALFLLCLCVWCFASFLFFWKLFNPDIFLAQQSKTFSLPSSLLFNPQSWWWWQRDSGAFIVCIGVCVVVMWCIIRMHKNMHTNKSIRMKGSYHVSEETLRLLMMLDLKTYYKKYWDCTFIPSLWHLTDLASQVKLHLFRSSFYDLLNTINDIQVVVIIISHTFKNSKAE